MPLTILFGFMFIIYMLYILYELCEIIINGSICTNYNLYYTISLNIIIIQLISYISLFIKHSANILGNFTGIKITFLNRCNACSYVP